jgi:hypothetical protein
MGNSDRRWTPLSKTPHICSVINTRDYLLHDCPPWRSHHPLLCFGGHFLSMDGLLRELTNLLKFFLVGLFPSPPEPIGRADTLYGESIS